MNFPNRAGDHPDTDDILRGELRAAGIPTIQEADGKPPEYMAEFFRRASGEVKTSVIGTLHGWTFKRAWTYWVASGPGIEIEAAQRLHEEHGTYVRVAGHCASPSPGEFFLGLACGNYHVDTQEGLNAIARTIRELVERHEKSMQELPAPSWSIGIATRYEEIGAHLCTRDGRKIGNAVVISNPSSIGGENAHVKILTEAGNICLMGTYELQKLFYRPKWLMDVTNAPGQFARINRLTDQLAEK
ncbi:MAG: hypothetical protein KDG50_10200 [Chromatiales bacterium]|nr:hypothetical protein [Chromatiales bacterium]